MNATAEVVLDAVREFWGLHGFSPSIRDVMEMTGISSTSVVSYNLRKLKDAGFIDYWPEITRSITVTGLDAHVRSFFRDQRLVSASPANTNATGSGEA